MSAEAGGRSSRLALAIGATIFAVALLLDLSLPLLFPAGFPDAGRTGTVLLRAAVLSLPVVLLLRTAWVRERGTPAGAPEAALLWPAIQQLPVSVVVTDAGGRIQYVNPAFTTITGYTAEEAVGATPRLLKSGQQDPSFYRGLWGQILAGQEWRGEVVNRRKDGTAYIQELVIQPVRDPDGQVTHFIGIGHDVTERRRAEQAAAENEVQFRALSDQSLTGIALIQDGGFVYVNPRLATMFGYAPEEMIDLQTVDVVSEPDRPMMRESIRRRLSGEVQSVHHFFTGLRRDGTLVELELFGKAVTHRGRPAALSTLLDISDRKRAAAALETQGKRFRSLIENSAEGIGLIAADTSAIYLSPAFKRMLHYPVEEWLGRPMLDLVHPDDRALAVGSLSQTLDSPGLPVTFQFRFRDAGGTWRWMEGSAVNHLADPAVEGVVVNWREVTERKEAEEALRASERRARTLFDTVHLIVLGLDAEGRVDYINPYFLQLTGHAREDVLGRSWVEHFVPGHQQGEWQSVFRELVEAESHPHSQNAILTRDGEERLIAWSNTVVRDPDGRALGTLSIGEDITEHRRLEAQYRQAQKMEAVGQLTGGIAHDFNNILMAIVGYSDLMLPAVAGSPNLADDVREIRKAADRATVLTRQLLAFSRRQVLVPQLLDLNALVADMGRMLQRLIGEDVSLRTTLADDLGTVRADPGQLEQVIMNLALNARDAMPDGGTLDIGTANVQLDLGYVETHPYVTPGPYISIWVTDAGSGMSREVMARLFEPFFTTKPVGKGTGLGLATVYGIVKQSGGHLSVYSEPGQGSTFKIFLPRVDEPAETVTRAAEERPDGGAETILVADDDGSVRALVWRLLSERGYQVLAADGPAAALATARAHEGTIDLLVTDVVMPGMSGRQLADELTALRPGLRVLYMSGYTHDAIVHRGVLEPGLHFLSKPVSGEVLLRAVRELLDAGTSARA